MTGNSPIRRDGGQLPELLEPADKAAVDDRNAIDKQQIGEPKRSCALVEDRQIVVGVSRAMGTHQEVPAAQIKVEAVGNEKRRRHAFAASRLVAESAAQPAQIIFA